MLEIVCGSHIDDGLCGHMLKHGALEIKVCHHDSTGCLEIEGPKLVNRWHCLSCRALFLNHCGDGFAKLDDAQLQCWSSCCCATIAWRSLPPCQLSSVDCKLAKTQGEAECRAVRANHIIALLVAQQQHASQAVYFCTTTAAFVAVHIVRVPPMW